MNIVVCIKQVPDTEAQVKLDAQNQLDLGSVKYIVSPYDEFAIEEALLAKKNTYPDATVIALTLGNDKAQDVLRTALAMGCDKAMHIVSEKSGWLSALSTGTALANAMKKLSPKLIFCGKQAIDHDTAVVAYVIAENLGAACVNVVQKAQYLTDSVTLVRESDASTQEHYTCTLPAVIGVTKGINKPRYPSLPGIMKAKKQPIDTLALTEALTADETHWISPQSYEMPKERATCKMLSGDVDAQATELVRIIREELRIL